MTRLLFFLTLLAAGLGSCGSPKSVSSFYRDHKRIEGVTNATIPGWLIYIGSSFAHDVVRDDNARMMLRLARKVKRLQFMNSEDMAIDPASVQAFVQNARLDGYEDLLLVRDEGATVNIMLRDQGDKLRHLLVLVNDDSEFTFLNLRTNLTMNDISRVIGYYVNKKGWDKEAPPRKKRKEKQRKQREEEEIVAMDMSRGLQAVNVGHSERRENSPAPPAPTME